MGENLSTLRFRNGEEIPVADDAAEWAAMAKGGVAAMCWYEGERADAGGYGPLYNGHALQDPRGLAPEGWRLPTDLQMQAMMEELGGRATCGGRLKAVGWTHWMYPNAGVKNSSGFSALPAGMRDMYGQDEHRQAYGYFWSSTLSGEGRAWAYRLGYFDAEVQRIGVPLGTGFSVRCLR